MRKDEFRYRITVEIDTPEGPKSGSSIHQITLRREPRLTPESGGWSLVLNGDAVPVDVAQGRTIYALLKSEAGNFPWQLLRHSLGWGDRPGTLRGHLRAAQREHATADLQPEGYPMFAVFGNRQEPASVELLDAASPDWLGGGVRLHRITIAMTDAPVTRSIRNRLPWLSTCPERRLKQPVDPYDHSPAAALTHGDLIQEN